MKFKYIFSNDINKDEGQKQGKLLNKIIKEIEKNDLSKDFHRKDILQRKLKDIKNSVILNAISMAELPFIVYLLYIKYNGKIELIPMERDCIIRAGDLNVANMSYLAAYIHFIEVRGDFLHIEGNVSQPSVFKERCSFQIKNNDNEVPCAFYDRGFDLKIGVNTYETRTVFETDIPLIASGNEILFSNVIDGHECVYGKINSMRFSPVADCIKHQYCVRGDWLIYIENNVLHCEKADSDKVLFHEELFQKELRTLNEDKGEWAISLRNKYFLKQKNKKKPIWLFMDRIDKADDNAEVFFKYVRSYREIDSYFIIQKDTEDYNRLKELKNVVALNSEEHYLLVLLADFIISSQSNGVVENPFWDDCEYFRDLYHQGKSIFLQHGVTKDNISSTLNRYNTNFTGFITSSVEERRSIIGDPFFYSGKDVWLTGLPRFDALYNNPKKYILIMPSWRKALMCQEWDESKNAMVWTIKEGFTKSEYVKRYRSLLNHKSLQKVCRKYGYKLVFMPHALMEPYIDEIIQSDQCLCWDSKKSYRDAFAEGNLMVTDYSSVAFDFAYLQKPVLYYQFDKEKFFREHTYKEGYYDYEQDGFGEVCYTEKKLVQLLIDYIKTDCKIKDKYKSRIQSTFAYHDKDCCKRVFDCIIGHGDTKAARD